MTHTGGRPPADDPVSHSCSTSNLCLTSDFGCEVSLPLEEECRCHSNQKYQKVCVLSTLNSSSTAAQGSKPHHTDKDSLPWWTRWTCESAASSQGSPWQCDLSCGTPCTPPCSTSGSGSKTPEIKRGEIFHRPEVPFF